MMTIKCDFCGQPESLALAHDVGRYTICGSCCWDGVTAEQIDDCNAQPERISRNDAERKAHVGLWGAK